MRNPLYILLASIMMLSVQPMLQAQDYRQEPVTVSKEKVKVGGKIFYSHIVLERQTLFSICKAYGVTLDQVYGANPTLKETGLKKNAIILIPEVEADAQVAEEPLQEKPAQEEAADAGNGGKETLKKDVETVPEESKVQDDTKTARQKMKEEKEKAREEKKRSKEEEKKYIIHTVKWYEDLDVISEKYNVPVNVIMAVNGLKGRKLSNRQKLQIPTAESLQEIAARFQQKETEGDVVTDRPQVQVQDTTLTVTETTIQAPEPLEKVEATLILPFDAIAEQPNRGSMDFYSGVLMAANDLGKEGTDINLRVYDVVGGNIPVTAQRLAESDIVIGPVSTGDITRLLEKCPAETRIISPLDHRAEVLAQENGNFIQAPSSIINQYSDIVRWIEEDKAEGDSLIVIYEKGYRESDATKGLCSMLDNFQIPYRTFSYSILEGRNILETLERMMTLEGENRVIVTSEREAFTNDVVRNINLVIHNEYSVTLYGPSKIRSFETIEVDNLHNAKFHTASSYFIDYERPEVRKFIMEYRALYNTEPTPFAFQGYDLMTYFVKLCMKYGKDWASHLEEAECSSMLQTDFKFSRNGGKGYVNGAVRRIVYGDDYSVYNER